MLCQKNPHRESLRDLHPVKWTRGQKKGAETVAGPVTPSLSIPPLPNEGLKIKAATPRPHWLLIVRYLLTNGCCCFDGFLPGIEPPVAAFALKQFGVGSLFDNSTAVNDYDHIC